MTKVTLNNVSNLVDTTTSQTTINNNNATITTAFDNTLSRDGTAPNQMGAALDMNSNRVVNLPQPISNTEPLRLQDLKSFTGGTLTVNSIPTGGNTGQVLTKNSNTSYDAVWQTPATSHGLITGGTANQVLSKIDGTDYNVQWSTPATTHSVIAGGTVNQVLTKNSGADYDLKWATPAGATGQTKYIVDLRDYMDAYYGAGLWTYRTFTGSAYPFTVTLGSDIGPALTNALNAVNAVAKNGRGAVYIPAGDWTYTTPVATNVLGGSYIIGDGSQCTRIFFNNNNSIAFYYSSKTTGGFTGGGLKGIGIFLEQGMGLSSSYAIYNGGTTNGCAGQMNYEDLYITSAFDPNAFWYNGFTVDGSARNNVQDRGCRVGTMNNIQIFQCRNLGCYFNCAVLWTWVNGGCYVPYTGSTGIQWQVTDSNHVYGLGISTPSINCFNNPEDIWINGTRYV